MRWQVIIISLAAFLTVACVQATAKPSEPEASKILLVLFFDKNCHKWCSVVRPIVEEMKKSYADRVDFAEIDVDKLDEARAEAKHLNISTYLTDVVDVVPEVAIFNKKRKRVKEIVGPKPTEVYETALKSVLQE